MTYSTKAERSARLLRWLRRHRVKVVDGAFTAFRTAVSPVFPAKNPAGRYMGYQVGKQYRARLNRSDEECVPGLHFYPTRALLQAYYGRHAYIAVRVEVEDAHVGLAYGNVLADKGRCAAFTVLRTVKPFNGRRKSK